ncbi:MAG: heat-inducible transcription repressor HrcA [Butyrivibrio sp.]|nr:heat-inducible transcription repressor HrcA [Butyrivibrio sp.]
MEMDERKIKILKAVIRNYLETGEPVGSRTVSKYTDLNLSSATIRNEMADLEEMGYILQPHTSAGRIPSDAGYRFYVDNMMQEQKDALDRREEELNAKESLLLEKVDRVEDLLQNVAKTLAANTNYATMVAAPHKSGRKIKFIQISQLERGKILAVLVLEGNTIKNTILQNVMELDTEMCLKLNVMLNSAVGGLTLEEINLSIISGLTAQAGEYGMLIRDILDAIAAAADSENDFQIYTSGATNIFKYPELSDNSKASELIYTLEEKQLLANLVNDSADKDGGIRVYIGEETPVDSMKDCSVVTATYELSDGAKGTIGIIGPKRMDYEKVVETIKSIKTQLDDAFKKGGE